MATIEAPLTLPDLTAAAVPLHVVILVGAKHSGKSTVARRLAAEWGFTHVSFAAKLREIMEALDPMVGIMYEGPHPQDISPITYKEAIGQYGYDGAKAAFPEMRRSLQRMGTEVFRNLVSESYWVDAVTSRLLAEQPQLIVADDCRFDNELAALSGLRAVGYVVEVFRVDRPGLLVDINDGHASETTSANWQADFIVRNDGRLEDLEAEADEIGRRCSA